MPVANVIPNADYFLGLCEGRKLESVAKKLVISPNTLRRLREGKPVAENIIRQIAKVQSCRISQLTVEPPESLLPEDPGFFTSLRYGWWIGPTETGSTCWFTETVKLEFTKADGDGVLHFGGRITNQINQVFEVQAVRRNASHFTLMSVCDDGTTWDGCLMLRKNDVLSGIWSGYPSMLEQKVTIYRYFISKKKLTLDELKLLTKQVKVECHTDADEFA